VNVNRRSKLKKKRESTDGGAPLSPQKGQSDRVDPSKSMWYSDPKPELSCDVLHFVLLNWANLLLFSLPFCYHINSVHLAFTWLFKPCRFREFKVSTLDDFERWAHSAARCGSEQVCRVDKQNVTARTTVSERGWQLLVDYNRVRMQANKPGGQKKEGKMRIRAFPVCNALISRLIRLY